VAPGSELTVRLTPRASRDAVALQPDGTLAVRVTAPPVDGRANEALCRLLARELGIAPSRVSLIRGHKGRTKVVRVEGLDLERISTALCASLRRTRR